MAVSTYSTNLTDIYAGAGSTSGWTALGGGASGLNAETDYYIQGTGMTSKNAFASSRKGMIYDSGSDRAATIGTDGAVLIWTTHATPNSVDTIANGGITAIVGSSTSDYKHWYVGGGDTIEFMGWILAAVNPSETTDEADSGSPTAVERYFGVLFDLPTGGPTKGAPNAIDAMRCGRCDLIYEFGTSTDPDASFTLAVADKGDETDRLGLIQERSGAFFCSGLHQLGSATNVVNFTDSNKTLFWNDHPAVTAPFNTVDIQNASSTVAMTNIAWKALGTKSPGTWTTTDNATVTLTTCNFIDWGTFTFDTNTTADTCSFLSCGIITPNGADLTASTVSGFEGTADTSALVWNVATNPNGLLDNMIFTKGTAATHAIEFGLSSPTSMTLTGINFSGYNAADGNNDSALHIKRTSGTVDITISGGSGTVSYKTDGATVNIISGAVTVQAKATLKAGTPVENARVFLKASDGTGPFPFEETVTSVTRSTITATVTHTAHGMATNDKIYLEGITDKVEDNYTVKTITVTGANTYTYPTTDSGSTSYTGTIKCTFVALNGLTNASGILSLSRVYSSNQPVTGWTRKSTSSPFLQEGVLVGEVDSSAGFSGTAVMLSDE